MNYKIVLIGSSQGGLMALKSILENLKRDFNIPLVIVQHREMDSDITLKNLLETYSNRIVTEPEDKDEINRGFIYLAPAGYHLLINENHFELSADDPINFSKPSIDAAFKSAADSFQNRVIGIVLTGANNDGAFGMAAIKYYNGLTIVQDPDSAENRTMPDAAIGAVSIDKILPLNEISNFLNELNN